MVKPAGVGNERNLSFGSALRGVHPAHYRYDIGANVEATSPAPAGQTYGKTTKRVFDSIGRLERNSVYVNTTEHSYVRYEFPSNGIQSKVYAPVVDVDGDGNIAEDEVYSESWTDGAGRTRMSRTEHPGSTGGWASTLVEYDMLGRVTRQSVPTETNSSYQPAGDDLTRGFLWTHQKYDWMNRVVRKINTDGADSPTLNDSDVLISYEGCGCAGGLVTTVEGELVPRTDTTGDARRKQKYYADILGRTFKTETFEWDGTTVYSTTVQSFDGADRAVKVRQYAGSTSSSTYQDTTATFDGHGRLYQSHKPEQRDSSNNLKYTTYAYNPDDSVVSVTDGRGAVTNFEYDSRGLLTEKSWTVPGGSGMVDPADVAYTYDNLGNRTAMTDGMGSVAYEHNSLSQLTAETRSFTDTLTDAPLASNSFKLEYEYYLTGNLKSFTDPYGEEIEYAYQKTGRLNAVTGTSFGGVTTYANNPAYRAWGALKHLEYGSGTISDIAYNDRLSASAFESDDPSDSMPKWFDRSYEYNADGKLKFSDESSTTYNDRFDRSLRYDHVGRIKDARTGIEAHGQTETDPDKLPYRQDYTYNAFGNMTSRDSNLWSIGDWGFAYTFSNNRAAYTFYDHDGRQTLSEDINFEYDASGGMNKTYRDLRYETVLDSDGDGREVKRSNRYWEVPDDEESEWDDWKSRYFIFSTVLGRNITEASETGKKRVTYVLAGGQLIARQGIDEGTTTEVVGWEHRDPPGTGIRNSYTGSPNNETSSFGELDPLGNNVGIAHLAFQVIDKNELSGGTDPLFTSGDSGDVEVDGLLMPGSMVSQWAVQQCPENDCGPRTATDRHGNTVLTSPFVATMDGGGFWVPDWGSTNVTVGGSDTVDDAFPESLEILGWDWVGAPIGQNSHKPWFIVGFEDSPSQVSLIQDQVKSMYNNDACSRAFEAAGLKSLYTMMNEGSLVFVREGRIKSGTTNEWLGDENLRSQMAEAFDKDILVNGVTPNGGYKGNYYVGLRIRAFTGGDNTPVHIIIHELIHAGSKNGSGVGSKEPIRLEDRIIRNRQTESVSSRHAQWRTPTHDLDWLNYKDGKYVGTYDAIIKACTPK